MTFQTLRWVRHAVCSPAFPVGAGADLTFIGGANDDLFYRPTRFAQLLSRALGAMQAVLRVSGVTDWEKIFGRAHDLAITTLDDQTADIAAIAACAAERGIRFRFVHDFLVWDLDGGRPAARETTYAARRQAVQESGAEFIDLLNEFGSTAGVAWMNDFIHPSAVGHRMIAELLCGRLSLGVSRPQSP
jgi:hypothetical protein